MSTAPFCERHPNARTIHCSRCTEPLFCAECEPARAGLESTRSIVCFDCAQTTPLEERGPSRDANAADVGGARIVAAPFSWNDFRTSREHSGRNCQCAPCIRVLRRRLSLQGLELQS